MPCVAASGAHRPGDPPPPDRARRTAPAGGNLIFRRPSRRRDPCRAPPCTRIGSRSTPPSGSSSAGARTTDPPTRGWRQSSTSGGSSNGAPVGSSTRTWRRRPTAGSGAVMSSGSRPRIAGTRHRSGTTVGSSSTTGSRSSPGAGPRCALRDAGGRSDSLGGTLRRPRSAGRWTTRGGGSVATSSRSTAGPARHLQCDLRRDGEANPEPADPRSAEGVRGTG